MALHEQSVGASDEWYTPAYVFNAMQNSFDVDVASPGREVTPWIPAHTFLTEKSLQRAWRGFVWMNSPFGPRNGISPWLARFCDHADGVALTPDRTSAPWWQEFAPRMDLILFVAGKIKFIAGDGGPNTSPAQGTCLMALGARGRDSLIRAQANGLGYLMRPACPSN